MKFCLIVFASATTANRVKSVLYKKFRINSTLMQTPKALPIVSCSYCLRFSIEHIDTVWDLVTQNGLSTKGIYREMDYEKLR